MRSLLACCVALLTVVLIVASAGGEGTNSRLASTYKDSVHNTTVNVRTSLELSSLVENQGNISGKVVIGPGLSGSGPFSGTMNPDGSVNFEDTPTDGMRPIFFTGLLRTDGSFSGTYKIPGLNQEGTWRATPSAQVKPVDQRFLGYFYEVNDKKSIDITRSPVEGEVKVSIKASEGLPGEGTLDGEISPNGEIRASGMFRFCTLLGGCSEWYCDVTGVISDNRLTGKYELVQKSKAGTTIGDVFEPRPSGNQAAPFDLKKRVPAFTPR
jgi:hypothetical protein